MPRANPLLYMTLVIDYLASLPSKSLEPRLFHLKSTRQTSTRAQIVDDNLGFAKDRTISRLTEMQSDEYLEAHAQAHAPELLLALQERRQARS